MTINNQILLYVVTAAVFVAWQVVPDRILKAIFAFLFMLLFLMSVRV